MFHTSFRSRLVLFHQIWARLKLKFDLTLTSDNLGNVRFILSPCQGLFSPSYIPIRSNWNFTWPWPWMTLSNFVLNEVILPSLPGLLLLSLSPIGASIWPDLDLRWPSPISFILDDTPFTTRFVLTKFKAVSKLKILLTLTLDDLDQFCS